MTPKDAPQFFGALAKLSVMHRQKMDKAVARVYYEALSDVPIGLLVTAIGRLVAHAGEFMPTSGKIRATVDAVQDDDAAAARVALEHPQWLALSGDIQAGPIAPACEKCGDLGVRQTCACSDFDACEKRAGSYCPEYKEGKYSVPVRPCECAETNPTIMLRKKATVQKRYAGTRRDRNFYETDV